MDEIIFNGPVKADVQAIGPNAQANKLEGTSPAHHAAPSQPGQRANTKITFNHAVTADVQAVGSGAQANKGLGTSQPQVTTRILFALSSPRRYELPRLNEEMRAVEEALRLSPQRERIDYRVLHAATSDDLRRALLEKSDQPYQILHLAGHGVSDGFVLEDAQGRPHKVARDTLAAYLSNYPLLRCVVLNACYSYELGKQLALGIPYVICMSGPLRDPVAVAFSRGFYDALGAGHDIDRAYNEGLGAVRFANLKHDSIFIERA